MDKTRVKNSLNKAVDLLEMLETFLSAYSKNNCSTGEMHVDQPMNQPSLPLRGMGRTLSECKSELENVLSEVELTFTSDDSEQEKKDRISLGTVEELSEALSVLASEIETSEGAKSAQGVSSLTESQKVKKTHRKSISDRIRSMPRVRVF